MHIVDSLREERIKVFLEQTSKREVIDELLDLSMQGRPAAEQEAARAVVHEREAVASTGIGAGVAVPHARVDFSDELIVSFGVSRAPVPFDAVDGQPVRIFFMVLCPASAPGLQLRFLARISRLMHDAELREMLLGCEESGGVLTALQEYESRHFG